MASQTVRPAAVGAPTWAARVRHPRRADDDRFVFPARLRQAGAWYVALTVPVCALLAWPARSGGAYLTTMLAVSLVYTVPGTVIAAVAARRAPAGDRVVWYLWAGVYAATSVGLAVAYFRIDMATVRAWSVPFTVVVLAARVAGGTLMLRARSGQRAMLVDLVDLLTATAALALPVGLLVGEAVVTSPHAWFTVAAALWAVAATHGLLVALVVRARLHAGDRSLATLAIALEVSIVVTSAAHLFHGVQGFRHPAGPFAAAYALSFGLTTLFFLSSARRPSAGLERLPPAAQVRRHSLIAVLVLAVVPVVALETWLLRHDRWVVVAAAVAAPALLALSSVRHLCSARETLRLYGAVERAARERGELLSDVMAHVDADRHLVAGHLHRQAATLHTAMASFTAALERAERGRGPTAAGFAAERLREDLSRQADDLRRLSLGVAPIAPAPGGPHRLAAPMRAYVASLYADTTPPSLVVDVTADLELDWTTEAILLRVVQEATHLARRRRGVATLRIAVRPATCGVQLEVVDDGDGPPPDPADRQVAAMRAITGFTGGAVAVERTADGRHLVRATLRTAHAPAPRPPRLRLVKDD